MPSRNGIRSAALIVCLEGEGFAPYGSSFESPLLNPEFHNLAPDYSLFEAAFGDFDGNGTDELSLGIGLFEDVLADFESMDTHSIDAAILIDKDVGDGDGDRKGDIIYKYHDDIVEYQISAIGIQEYKSLTEEEVEEVK